MVITFINQKGGVGKSTSCILLGSVLKAAGYNVCFDDHDPQESVSCWAETVGKMPLKNSCENPDVVLCDTPGRLDFQNEEKLNELREVIRASDRLIVVCEKSPFSIQASKAMCDFVIQNKSESSRAHLLFNKVRPNTVVGKQANEELASPLGISPLQNSLPLAAPFENIQSQGLSAVQGKHREIVLKLALEILK